MKPAIKKKKLRREKRPAPLKRESAAPASEDLNAASRALLGRDGNARAVRPPPEDASVEDPLLDWPED